MYPRPHRAARGGAVIYLGLVFVLVGAAIIAAVMSPHRIITIKNESRLQYEVNGVLVRPGAEINLIANDLKTITLGHPVP